MVQPSLFESNPEPAPKPASDDMVRLRLLITVKAAPNPSGSYGETVCVAGLSLDPNRPGWIRLYPINFRALDADDKFKKYELVTVDAVPARQDQRESWKPIRDSFVRERHLDRWPPRRSWLDPHVEDSMCQLNRAARAKPDAQSLALVRPREISDLEITQHPGWTSEQQKKIDEYASQPDLFGREDRTPLEPPRLRGHYRYRCHDPRCGGHRQGMLDWEFVALQRRLLDRSDEDAAVELQKRFLEMMCNPDREVAFYVGNQAKRPQTFSVLGVYYPRR